MFLINHEKMDYAEVQHTRGELVIYRDKLVALGGWPWADGPGQIYSIEDCGINEALLGKKWDMTFIPKFKFILLNFSSFIINDRIYVFGGQHNDGEITHGKFVPSC